MKNFFATFALLSTSAQLSLADYGWQFSNALSTGPTADNSWIRESNTTLILPAVNTPQTGNLALWPGMGTDGGDLIQALAISTKDGRYESEPSPPLATTIGANLCSAGCPDSEGVWCIVASTLEGQFQLFSDRLASH